MRLLKAFLKGLGVLAVTLLVPFLAVLGFMHAPTLMTYVMIGIVYITILVIFTVRAY